MNLNSPNTMPFTGDFEEVSINEFLSAKMVSTPHSLVPYPIISTPNTSVIINRIKNIGGVYSYKVQICEGPKFN